MALKFSKRPISLLIITSLSFGIISFQPIYNFLLFNTSVLSCYAQTSNSPDVIYQSYLEAQRNADLISYKKYLCKALFDDISKEPKAEEYMKFGAVMTPKNVSIKNVAIQGDKAIVTATGNFGFTGDFGTGEIVMVKENGAWKVKTEDWKSKDKNASANYKVGF